MKKLSYLNFSEIELQAVEILILKAVKHTVSILLFNNVSIAFTIRTSVT